MFLLYVISNSRVFFVILKKMRVHTHPNNAGSFSLFYLSQIRQSLHFNKVP